MTQRREQAETAVLSLHGQNVQLQGYLVPVAVEPPVNNHYLFVPWAGACSTPPPPMNQIIRLQAAPSAEVLGSLQEPVLVSGLLRVQTQEQRLFLADGQLMLRSAYALDAAVIQALPRAVKLPLP